MRQLTRTRAQPLRIVTTEVGGTETGGRERASVNSARQHQCGDDNVPLSKITQGRPGALGGLHKH